AKCADLLALELAWVIDLAGAVKNISLPRSALKKNRQPQKRFAFLFGAHQRCRGHLGDVEFSLNKPIMHLARCVLIPDIFKIVTVERNQPIDESAIARIRISRKSNFGFIRHASFSSKHFQNLTTESTEITE